MGHGADITQPEGRALDYYAKRVVGARWFDLTPEYAKSLREIADQCIDPKLVGAIGILEDLAARIDALKEALVAEVDR